MEHSVPKPKSNWSQFSLRSLLLATFVCSVVLGVWSKYLQPFAYQKAAMKVITDSGATLRIEAARGPAWQSWLVDRIIGPNAFTYITAADFQLSSADDPILQQVRYLPYLQDLNIDGRPITVDGMRLLLSASQLKSLSMRHTPCTDEFMPVIAQFTSLEILAITGTKVTDVGLANLQSATNLREVYARWTPITATGVSHLQRTHPNCKVYIQTTATDPP